MGARDDERGEIRRERQLRRLGTRDPVCRFCGEREPLVLVRRDGGIACYECLVRVVERHHPAGQHNDPATVALPANLHRVVTEEQRDWPDETLRNPRQNQTRRAAAWLRGLADTLRLILRQLEGIIELLERLDEQLTGRFGDAWEQKLGSEEAGR